jgi:hypothetical protein
MQGKPSTSTWGLRLLFITLLLGIVTMHTLGHPTRHDSTHSPHLSSSTAPYEPAQHLAHVASDAADTPSATDPAPTAGLDLASVCLAVLGAWTFVLLAVGCLSHLSGDPHADARARMRHALRPMPPPGRRALLAQLSVLRT